MQSYPETAFYYTIALFFAFNFAFIAENSKSKKNKQLFILLTFIFIVFFNGFRFFVGNDYSGYYYNFQRLNRYKLNFFEQRWEPAIYLIASIFKKSSIGYLPFLFTCTFITYIFIFKTLIRENVFKWGIYFTFTLGLMIMANDQVRQGVALSIFLYSIKYIEQKNFKKYFLWILCASLFHYTAIALLPVYFLKNIHLHPIIWSLLIIITYIGYRFGIFYNTIFSLVEKIPYYGELYASRTRFFEIETTGSGLGVLFRALLAFFVAIFSNKTNKSIYTTIFLFGSVLANISVGFMPFERLTYYLVYTNIIVFPLLLKNKSTKYLTLGIVIISFLYFEVQSLYGLDKHGAVPYRTFFNENIENPPLRYLIE